MWVAQGNLWASGCTVPLCPVGLPFLSREPVRACEEPGACRGACHHRAQGSAVRSQSPGLPESPEPA